MKFVKSQSRKKPLLIEVSGDIAYVRKNVTAEIIEDNIFYIYDEAELTIEEFNAYANTILISGQEESTSNQLIIMEAMADMYETVALNM